MRVRTIARETAPLTETAPPPMAAAPVTALVVRLLVSLAVPVIATCASPTIEASVFPPTLTSATDAPTAAMPEPAVIVAARLSG